MMAEMLKRRLSVGKSPFGVSGLSGFYLIAIFFVGLPLLL